MHVELPRVFAIHVAKFDQSLKHPSAMASDTFRYRDEYAYFQCTDRTIRLYRKGSFPWLKEYNERLLIWNEENFIVTGEGYWKLKSGPRAKSRYNMVYHFYAEKIL